MQLPVIAIVGRPNVGKSTLFNKLIGKRISIVNQNAGVTRDRIFAKAEWLNSPFWLIDTGGIEFKTNDKILIQMRKQAELAISSADAIIFVTDLQSGLTAADQAVAQILIKSGKPMVLCVNKCDSVGSLPMPFYEFYNLGLNEEPIPVSAVHGHGTGDLLDAVFEKLPKSSEPIVDAKAIHIAVIGRPNAGKSSLINKILNENRMIVTDIAGTTRDAVDSVMKKDGKSYVWIDTAGIRRKSKVTDEIEHYSILRAQMAIERADICILLIDATEKVAEQDTKIAGIAHNLGKGMIIALNKWDLIKKDEKTIHTFKKEVAAHFSFMSYAPILFISAQTGQRVSSLFNKIDDVYEQNHRFISTGALNDMLAYSTSRVQPPTDKGKRLKIYYITQSGTQPPTFVCFVNQKSLFHFSYQRYIENQIRENFKLLYTPIHLQIRERRTKKE